MVRFHMPGHKGAGFLGCEGFDITEVSGADELYEAEGIIAESEENAASLFGSRRTCYSTEGSSQCIRAMLRLSMLRRPDGVILAARNVHKAFVYGAALLGLAFLLRCDRCLLADEMGLGKTVQALAWLCQTGAYPAMVVAPPHLMRNWENEIARFVQKPDGSPLRVHVIHGLKPYALPPADIYLMHYLLLRGWKEALPGYGSAHGHF